MKISKALIISILIIAFIGITASAMPDSLLPGEEGNTAELIVITKPPKDRSATFDRSYVISGYGKEGTLVAIYKLAGGVFVKTDYEWQIGASTYFAIPIELDGRKNILRCRAEDGNGNFQHARLEITYLGNSISDMVKNITVDPSNIPY
ncbi:MAG: hypothetical protein M0R40_02275 [Firmicutes bacterium]|nr:hypothetical protein [Bacillota bacterium]